MGYLTENTDHDYKDLWITWIITMVIVLLLINAEPYLFILDELITF